MTKREQLITYLAKKEPDILRDRDLEVAKTGRYNFACCPMYYNKITGVADVYELGHNMDGDECTGNCTECWKKVLQE